MLLIRVATGDIAEASSIPTMSKHDQRVEHQSRHVEWVCIAYIRPWPYMSVDWTAVRPRRLLMIDNHQPTLVACRSLISDSPGPFFTLVLVRRGSVRHKWRSLRPGNWNHPMRSYLSLMSSNRHVPFPDAELSCASCSVVGEGGGATGWASLSHIQ